MYGDSQITGHRNCGGWEDCGLSPTLYPYAFLLPERSTGYVQQRMPEEAPAPLKPWFAIPGPVAENTASPLVTGHRWKAKVHRKYLRAGYWLLLGWYINLPALGDKQYFVQPSNRHKDLGEAAGLKHSLIQEGRIRRDRRRIRTIRKFYTKLPPLQNLKAIAVEFCASASWNSLNTDSQSSGCNPGNGCRLPLLRQYASDTVLRFWQELLINATTANHHDFCTSPHAAMASSTDFTHVTRSSYSVDC